MDNPIRRSISRSRVSPTVLTSSHQGKTINYNGSSTLLRPERLQFAGNTTTSSISHSGYPLSQRAISTRVINDPTASTYSITPSTTAIRKSVVEPTRHYHNSSFTTGATRVISNNQPHRLAADSNFFASSTTKHVGIDQVVRARPI